MALSYISYAGTNNNAAEFYADIGTNQYYRYRIGNARTRVNGLDMLDDIIFNSELFNHNDTNPFNSRFIIKVPANLFSKNRQYIQLFSYADVNGKSPAISSVVEVNMQMDLLNNEWPILTQSKMMYMQTSNNHPVFNPCRSVSFSFEESKFSNAMFLDTLLQAAKVLAPMAVDAIVSLLTKKDVPAGTSNQPAAGATNNNAATNENILKVVNAIIDAVGQQPATQAAGQQASNQQQPSGQQQPTNTQATNQQTTQAVTNPSVPQSISKILSYSNGFSYKQLKGRNHFKNQRRGFAKQQIIDGGVLTGPLLISLLGPLLQQAPQLIQAIGDTPVKLLNAKNEGDLKKQQEDNNYLSNLLAQHNQNVLLQLLINSGKLNQLNPPVAMSFSNNNNIKVSFDNSNPVTVSGKQKFVYQASTPVKLLLHVDASTTPPSRPIPKAIVQLEIKEACSLKLIFEKKYRMKDVYLNSILELDLLPNELQTMLLNTDLLVTASFIWPSKSAKRNEGKSDIHAIYLVRDYFLNTIGDKVGIDTALTDINKYRVFWNKIWEGSSNQKRRWQTDLDAKYYVYYRHDADSNARIETKLKVNPQADEEDSSRLVVEGKLKSGLEVSPVELNKLLPDISNFPSLTPQQLQALQTDDMQKHFNQEAKTHLELKGKKDETGAVWAYPNGNASFWKVVENVQRGSRNEVPNVAALRNKAVFGHKIITVVANYTPDLLDTDIEFGKFISTVEAYIIANSQLEGSPDATTWKDETEEPVEKTPASVNGGTKDEWDF